MPRRTGSQIVGQSHAIRKTIQLIDRIAVSDCGVLIEGESGTGKELLARRIHEQSNRREEAFIPVNCAGVSETLFESQFFGHIRGSFTGADQDMLGMVRSADRGTLFMDEIGDFPASLQPKLLRVLQENEVSPVGQASPIPVNVRFVAATNRDLVSMVEYEEFRADLYFRINVVSVRIPPLRERPSDIPLLLSYFCDQYAERHGLKRIELSACIVDRLKKHTWPGNVRELRSWVERLYVTGLRPADLVDSLVEHEVKLVSAGVSLDGAMSMKQAERQAIQTALREAEGNRRRAARILGIGRNTLTRKLQQYEIS